MRKKHAALFPLLLTCLFLSPLGLCAQGSSPANAAKGDSDVVVVLDTSQSVLPYFRDVTDYVVSSLVRDYLRKGDTFHLLSFGDSTQVEVAQRLVGENDVKSILGRLYLLYPLARYTDLVGALKYLHQYLSDLPESRKKTVVIITDGVQNPSKDSPSAAMTPEAVAAEIEHRARAIRAQGWSVYLIKLPFAPSAAKAGSSSTAASDGSGQNAAGGSAQSSTAQGQNAQAGGNEPGGTSYFDQAAKALGASVSEFTPAGKEDLARRSLELPSVEFPGHLGRRGYAFSFPLRISNVSPSSLVLELEQVRIGVDNVLRQKSFLTLAPGKTGSINVPLRLPATVQPGEKNFETELYFANGMRVSPQSGNLRLTLVNSPLEAVFRSSARVLLFALIVILTIIALLIVLGLLRRLPRQADATVVAAVRQSSSAGAAAVSARPAAEYADASSTAKVRVDAASSAISTKAVSSRAAEAGSDSAAHRADRSEIERFTANREKAADLARAAQERQELSAQALAEAAHQSQGSERARTAMEEAARLKREERERKLSSIALLAEAARNRRRTGLAVRAPSADAGQDARGPGETRSAAAFEKPAVLKPGTGRFELRVLGQNPHIGMRNIHTMRAGDSKTLGGGRSDFLVFLMPAPRKAAEVFYDGEDITIIPRRLECFPDADGPIKGCLGRDIPMLGKNGYPFILRFSVYEPPIERIHRLLHCIELPGLIDA